MARKVKRPMIDEPGKRKLYPSEYKRLPNFMEAIPSWMNVTPTVEAAERNTRQYSLDEIASIINREAERLAPGNFEFKNVLHAIALAESGGNNMLPGDHNQSFGVFQNRRNGVYEGKIIRGRGGDYSIEQLQDPEFEIPMAVSDLYRYYLNAKKLGLKGADAARYTSKYGQRPLSWPSEVLLY